MPRDHVVAHERCMETPPPIRDCCRRSTLEITRSGTVRGRRRGTPTVHTTSGLHRSNRMETGTGRLRALLPVAQYCTAARVAMAAWHGSSVVCLCGNRQPRTTRRRRIRCTEENGAANFGGEERVVGRDLGVRNWTSFYSTFITMAINI
jgi:hypothetical protein